MQSVSRGAAALLTMAACLAVTACGIGDTVNRLRDETPHERYTRGLRDAGLDASAMGREWLVAADTVLRQPHRIVLPLKETGYYNRGEARAVGWQFDVRDGQRVAVVVTMEGQPAQVFTDLFTVTTDSIKRFERVVSGVTDSTKQSVLRYETRDSLTLVLRVQPELLRGGRYEVTIRSEPVLAFPVEGRGNGAVQSFWGVDRDGGVRSHQGIDIFAPRGTPVLAATDGRIASIRSNNLGGNVIWQADDHRAQSLYYAHLDSHAVTAGAHVVAGDTIGFVGNTGNARTTTPHLHFGIYRRGRGAIDPWPYVRRTVGTFAPIRADTSRLGVAVRIQARAVTLRSAPVVRADSVGAVERDSVVTVVGAASTFYRVQLDNGVAGYIPAGTLVRRVSDSAGVVRRE